MNRAVASSDAASPSRPDSAPSVASPIPMSSSASGPLQARAPALARSATSRPGATTPGSAGSAPPSPKARTQSKDRAKPGGTGNPSAVSRASFQARRP